MRILFTPAGDTDPVRGFRDGAMLHILRHYPADKVIVFLTKDMEEKEEAMQCYSKGIKLLAPGCTVSFIKSGITEPQDFEKLTVIQSEFDKAFNDTEHEGAEWLLNISSGTPQIKTVMSLLALDYPQAKAIQVASPEGKSNRGNNPCSTTEELMEMLECNEDNEPDAPDRTSEPPLLLLKKHGLVLQVESLVKNYEYAGALQLIKFNPTLFSETTKKLLEHAALRKDLMWRDANKVISCYKDIILIENADDFSEYFQILEMCQRKKQLPEFVLKLPPVLTELGYYYLKKLKGFCLDDCGYYKKNKAGSANYFEVTRGNLAYNYPAMLNYIETELNSVFRNGPFNFKFILLCCKYFESHELSGDERHKEISSLFQQLRVVEKEIRHPVAHTITNKTDMDIKNASGVDSRDVLRSLHKVVKLIRGRDIQWSYNRLNGFILDSLRE